MTFETLLHIHKLLLLEETRTNEAYKKARDLQHEYEEANKRKDTIKEQEELADRFMIIHNKALDALLEFERKEWS